MWGVSGALQEGGGVKLQALVYDILSSTTAAFSYAAGSRKLSDNEQFCCCCWWWCSNSSKFVTNNSDKTRRVIYSRQQSLHKHKLNHNRLNRDGTLRFFFFFFCLVPGVDASHVYVRALALGCFYSRKSYHTSSTAFRHLPPNSARFCYATDGALFISAQLSTDAVSALRKVRVLI